MLNNETLKLDEREKALRVRERKAERELEKLEKARKDLASDI
jgi:hypothetical protein